MSYARILGNLYQGDVMSAVTDAGKFDVVVLCAEELPRFGMEFPPGVRVVEAGIDDAELTPKEAWIAQNAAETVVRELGYQKRVLVTCFAGRNRSGLVSALTLKRLGWPGDKAIEAVRAARRNALTNESFVRYLRT